MLDSGEGPTEVVELKTPDLQPDPAPWPADGARVRTRASSLLEVRIGSLCALQAETAARDRVPRPTV